MDLYITGTPAQQSRGGLSPQAKFFEPVTSKSDCSSSSSSSRKNRLTFHLIIFDPASDSSLTPGWTIPVEALVVQEPISISALISLLRDHLPIRRHRLGLSVVTDRGGTTGEIGGEKHGGGRGVSGSGGGSGGGSGSSSSGEASSTRAIPSSSTHASSTPPSPGGASNGNSNGNGSIHENKNKTKTSPTAAVGALFGKLRRPKLEYAHVFLTRSPDGEVVPLCRDDADWHYKGAYARVDLTNKSELEWRLFKELVVAADGQFKCYLAIKGQGSRSPFSW